MLQLSKEDEISKTVASLHLMYFIRHNPDIDDKKFNVPKPITRMIKKPLKKLALTKFEKDFIKMNVIVKSSMRRLENYLSDLDERS